MNEAARFYAWAQLRSTWRRRLALIVLIGAVGTIAMGSAASATRTSSAVDRFLDEQRAFDVIVFCGPLALAEDCEQELAAHDEIQDTAPLVVVPALLFAGGRSIELTDDTCFGGPGDIRLVVAPDGRFGTVVNTRRYIEGRAADPARAEEVTISRELARRTDLGVGDTIDVKLFAGADCLDDPDSWEPGPELTVVGVEVSPFEVQPESGPYLSFALGSSALLEAVGDLPDLELIVAGRLRPGSTIEDLALPGLSESPEQPGAALPSTLNSDNLKRSTRAFVTGQWLIAGLIAAAGLILLGQMVDRQTREGAAEFASLGQLGLTRRDLLAVGTAHILSVVVPAALLAAIGGYLTSAFTPFGVARIIEVDGGMRLEAAVLGLGAVAMILGLLLVAIPAVIAAAGRQARADSPTSGRASSLAHQLGGGPVSTTGLRMAFEPLRGPNAPPLRTGLGIIVVAVIMLVGATVFAGSLTHLLASDHLVGWNWDALIYIDNGDRAPLDADELRAAALAAPGVAEATPGTIFPPLRLYLGDERLEVQSLSFDGGPVGPTLISGRAPSGADEIVLGRETIARLGVSEDDEIPYVAMVGDFEAVASGGGTEVPGTVTIVGTGVLPSGGGANRLGTGSAVDFEFFRSLVPGAQPDGVFVRLDPGAHLDDVEASLVDTLGADGVGSFTDEIISPELGDLDQVRNLPIALAAMLALLAVGVVAQVIIGSTHARRGELGILRALGMRPRQIKAAIIVQAVAISGAALIVGVPLGIALGRKVWQAFALSLGTKPEVSLAAAWLGALIVGLLVLASLLGLIGSARHRRQLAATLRRE